jgi:REP element-mobilizing transposase RayT
MSGNQNNRDAAVRVPPRPTDGSQPNAASGDAAYNTTRAADVGRFSSTGADVGRVPSRGVPDEPPPRRLRRLHRVWPDRDGNISYLLTLCVDGRARVLDNEITFERFVSFLLESPTRYHWFGRRFVVMPDHIHLIAHQGHDAIRLGQWIKALKAVVGGLERREERPVGRPGLQKAISDAASGDAAYNPVGRLPSAGGVAHKFTRIKRAWRWQDGFHDHKFRTPESETREWEYVCLNPVRAGLVKRPEEWPFGGEIFYDEAGGPRLIRGTPPLLENALLIEDDGGTKPRGGGKTPVEGNRPTT